MGSRVARRCGGVAETLGHLAAADPPVMLFVTIMTTIGSFQVFGQPYLLTRGGPELATRGVVQYIYETAFNNYRLGYGAAMSWLLFVIIAVFSLARSV